MYLCVQEKFEALVIEKEDYQRKCEEFAGVDVSVSTQGTHAGVVEFIYIHCITHAMIQEKLKLIVSEKEDLEKKSEELKGSLAEYSVST